MAIYPIIFGVALAGAIAMQKRTLLSGAMSVVMAAAILAGCNKPADPVTQAAKKDAAAGVPAPLPRAPARRSKGADTKNP